MSTTTTTTTPGKTNENHAIKSKPLLSIKLQTPTTSISTITNTANNTIAATNKNEKNPSTSYRQQPSFCMYLAAFSALLGSISFGLGVGWTAPAFEQLSLNTSVPYLYEPRDKTILTWISSSMPLSALFGAFLSDLMVRRYGRQKSLLSYGIPFSIGWLLIIAAQNAYMILIGRIILGLAIGAYSGTASPYIIDISTIKTRGTLGALFQLFIVTGILFAYIIGALLHWRIATVVSMTPTIIQMILIYFMPEGPNWLLQKKRNDEAKKALIRIRSKNSEIDKEFEILIKESITKTKKNDDKEEENKWKIYSNKKHFFPLILSLGLMMFQQLSGINAVMYYATSILRESGSTIKPNLGTISIGAAQWIATFIGTVLSDIAGRRLLLMTSGSIHVISMLTFGLYYFFSASSSFGWIPVVSMIAFIIGFSTGWGPVPWILVAEITPHESKSLTVAMSSCMNWTLAFVVTKTFKDLQDLLTKYGVFFLFASLSAISVVFTLLLIPETKNKSYQQIREYFEPTTKTENNNNNNKFPIIDLTSKDSDTLTRSSDSA